MGNNMIDPDQYKSPTQKQIDHLWSRLDAIEQTLERMFPEKFAEAHHKLVKERMQNQLRDMSFGE